MTIVRAKALHNIEVPNVAFLEEGKEYTLEATLAQTLEERGLIEKVTESEELKPSERKLRK